MLYLERLFESLQPLYYEPWFPLVAGTVVLAFAYSIYQTLRSLPKLVMLPIVGAACAIVMLNWVYNRNEPEMITPLVNVVAPFLPNK